MLGISDNNHHEVDPNEFDAVKNIKESGTTKVFRQLFALFVAIVILILFLPWTQYITARGFVTTLEPEQRPQEIHSVIPGQIIKWYVREGDFVRKGDTIVKLAETKSEYFDPNLIDRTNDQVGSKMRALQGYKQKIEALENQSNALLETKRVKIRQAQNYIKQARLQVITDSVEVEAYRANNEVAKKQLERSENLFEKGLKSLTDLETKRLKVQETNSKFISLTNKLESSRNKLNNSYVELSSIRNQYDDKLSKVASDRFSAVSALSDGQITISKLKNTLANYIYREKQYYILAPQNSYITEAIKSGVGEMIKEGESLVSIMPSDHELAVEMYVDPIDLPLITKGQKVRFMFDGWPSIVFGGWPTASFGTFGGKVVAIDYFISENGKYRLLVAEDEEDDHLWPKGLRVGAGASSLVFLNDVSIWYELWRNLNGFPPDFYKLEPAHNTNKKK